MEKKDVSRIVITLLVLLVVIMCLYNCISSIGFKIDRQYSRIVKICDFDFTDYRQIQKDRPFFQKENSIFFFNSEKARKILENEEEFASDTILKKVYETSGIILDAKIIEDQLLVIIIDRKQNKLAIMNYMNPKNAIIVNTDAEMFSKDLNQRFWFDTDIILCQSKDCKSVYVYDFSGNLLKTNTYEKPVICAYLGNNKVLIYKNVTRLEQSEEGNIYYTKYNSESEKKIEVIACNDRDGLLLYYDDALKYSSSFPSNTKKMDNEILKEIEYEEETFGLYSRLAIPANGVKDSFLEYGINVICYGDGLGWMNRHHYFGGDRIYNISRKNLNLKGIINAFHFRTPVFYNTENNKTNVIACSIFFPTGNSDSLTNPDELHIFDYPPIYGKLIGVADDYLIGDGSTGFFVLADTGLYFAYTPVKYKDFGG